MSGSSSFAPDLVINEGTVFSPKELPVSTDRLLAEGFETLARTVFPRLDPEASGIVVAAVSPFRDEHCGGLVGLSGSQKLFSGVVGRHSEATFALPADRGLSLRHGILIARITDDGCPVLRVLDLRSGTGMSDAEGEPHRSVIANGPLRLRMGNSALFAIPADALFRKDGPVPYDGIDWPAPRRWIPEQPPEERLESLSDLLQCSTALSLEPGPRGPLFVGGAGDPCAGRLVVESEGRREAVFQVSATALRQGVLVGRYPRCDISAANAILSEAVSRVHALFLELDGAVRVFDTGSFNGVFHQERDANGMELSPDRPTSLLLGHCDEVTWEPAWEPAG